MIVAIHQPHYFPWIGYFDKMAKAEAFVLLDEVQLEKGSQMQRNRVLDGSGEIRFITISGETNNYLNREYRDIKTKNLPEWTKRQLNALQNYYLKAKYKDEIMPIVTEFLSRDYETICEWTVASIKLVNNILEIQTPLVYQSSIVYDRMKKKSELVYSICNSLGADTYLSGCGGSIEYLDRDKFLDNGVKIVFQDFVHPEYSQCGRNSFVKGVSVLDMLFNCGIIESRNLFWKGIKNAECD